MCIYDNAFSSNEPIVTIHGTDTILVGVHVSTLESYDIGPLLCGERLHPNWGWTSVGIRKNGSNFTTPLPIGRHSSWTQFGRDLGYRFRTCPLSSKNYIQEEVDSLMKPEFEKSFDSNSPFVTIIGHDTILVGVHVDTLSARSGGREKLCHELMSPTWGWDSVEAKTDPLDFAVVYDPDEQKTIFGRNLKYRFRVRHITDRKTIQKTIARLTKPVLQSAFEQDDPIVTVQGANTILVGVHVDTLSARSGGREKLCHGLISPTWGWNSVEAKTDPLEFDDPHGPNKQKDIFGLHLKYRFRIGHVSDKDLIRKEIARLTKPHFQGAFEQGTSIVTIQGTDTILVGVHHNVLETHNRALSLCEERINIMWGHPTITVRNNPLNFDQSGTPPFGGDLEYRFRVCSIKNKDNLNKEINEMKNVVHDFYELIDDDKRAMILTSPENSIVLIRNDVLTGAPDIHYVMGHTISPSWGHNTIGYEKDPLRFVISEADFHFPLSGFRAKISNNSTLEKVKNQIDALLSEKIRTHYWD